MKPELKTDAARYLTSQEIQDLETLRDEPGVIGFALLSADGEELDVSGMWENLVPMFENIFDLSKKVGEGLGEQGTPSTVSVESAGHEIVGIILSEARAILLKRKGRAPAEVISGVR